MPRFSEMNQFWRTRCVEAGFQFIDVPLPENDPEISDITANLLAMVLTLRNRNRPVIVRTLGIDGHNIQMHWSVDGESGADGGR